MTGEEIQFVKKWFHRITGGHQDAITAQSFVIEGHEFLHLLTLLVQEAAMREKAEFYLRHPRARYNENFCLGCDSQQKSHWEDEHFWTDSDWIQAIKKRWGLE